MSGQYDLGAPAMNAVSYTDTDTSDNTFPQTSRMIYVGATGNLSLDMYNGSTVVFVGCAAGTVLPVRAVSSNSASTVSDITVLW